jgi:hypothetical protein
LFQDLHDLARAAASSESPCTMTAGHFTSGHAAMNVAPGLGRLFPHSEHCTSTSPGTRLASSRLAGMPFLIRATQRVHDFYSALSSLAALWYDSTLQCLEL